MKKRVVGKSDPSSPTSGNTTKLSSSKGGLKTSNNSSLGKSDEPPTAKEMDGRVVFRWRTAFLALFTIRLVAAVYLPVADCDETFNYWEPSHFLTYGYGFQTWEYSPTYTLRPYIYALIHATIGRFFSFFVFDKIQVFFLIRIALGIFCAACETIFYRGVSRRFGSRVGLLTLFFLITSAGMFISAPGHLPNTFSMYGVLLAFGAWFSGYHFRAVVASAFGVILGWPFVAVVFLPMGLDIFLQQGPIKAITWAIFSVALFLVPSVLVDYYYYEKWVVSVGNLIWYNVFDSSHTGSQLFGVEPWTYYAINLFLNFNFLLFLSLVSLPFLVFFRKWSGHLNKKQLKPLSIAFYFLPLYLWLAAMLRLPHKEERFLFVIYPLICLGAAVTFVLCLDVAQVLLGALNPSGWSRKFLKRLLLFIGALFLVATVGFSLMRVGAVTHNYSAPLYIYDHLYHNELPKLKQGEYNICIGKEWYRFPSNFFLPEERFHLQFIKSSFTGELPKPYAKEKPTSSIPSHMNHLNMEEPTRYIPEETCHYYVDFEFAGQKEKLFSQEKKWKTLVNFPFLDKENSHPFFRAFYLPYFSERYITMGNYYLFKNTELFPQ